MHDPTTTTNSTTPDAASAELVHAGSLLLTLEEISQLVAHSRDPAETLSNIVRLIQGRFHTDVCSVYLLDLEVGQLVLGATIGLKPDSVGRVRMRIDEGLTGLVAENLAPVNVADAFQHPRFKYFPEAGEDPYRSFLGVPLVEGGALQGVLVVQTVPSRDFTSNESRMLVTVGTQLASLVSGARLIERVVAFAQDGEARADAIAPRLEPATLQAASLSPGVGLGWAHVINGFEWQTTGELSADDPAEEQRRLDAAIQQTRDELTRLSQRISSLVGEYHGAILQTQLMLLQDRSIQQDLSQCVAAGATAEAALGQTLDKYVAVFQKLKDRYFQERIYDVKDVFRRIAWHLQPRPARSDAAGDRLVLVAREASVIDLFSVDQDALAAVIVEHGGPQSHAAILARSLDIPMVGQARDVLSRVRDGQQLLVDGTAGIVYFDPPQELIASQTGVAEVARIRGSGVQLRSLGDFGYDESLARSVSATVGAGLPRIEANINLLAEVPQAVAQQASGVGLFRTEFLFLARRTLPTEEEQVGIYRKLLKLLDGRPASIRTFDLRPDKLAHLAHLNASSAAAYDWRLVLDSPPLQKLFKDQVRAILRAATVGPARILVPLVVRTETLDFVLETVQQARDELQRDGLEHSADVPLGIMIEVAAAAAMVPAWAGRVDYFSLGTNDLLASALGIDRDDPVGSRPNDLLHPGLLRMIHNVAAAARAAGRSLTVCGEMAADPAAALALSAFQVAALSVPVHQLRSLQTALTQVSFQQLSELPGKFLDLQTAREVQEMLRQYLETLAVAD
jgi:phosphotransferase system enzyme I (PtsP)